MLNVECFPCNAYGPPVWQSLHEPSTSSPGCLNFCPLGESSSMSAAVLCARIVWQVLLSLALMVRLPSEVLCSPSWQRKHPGQSLWPMLFGYLLHEAFISGKKLSL